jgi:aspartate/methionine/tyrosine aminotransferase
VLVVSPNNPTGSYLTPRELEQIAAFCRQRDCALVVDEVFADYPLDAAAPLTDVAMRADVLAFTLGGLSKTVGLPQLKLGWMVVGGPEEARGRALTALELIADSYLSVATPVQVAASDLLIRAAPVRAAIHSRVRRNLEAARQITTAMPACTVLRAEGGWSIVVRIPATRSEEAFTLDLLATERILVHPGYFFDFPREAFVVVSLLPPEAIFAEAFARVVRAAVS